MNTNISIETELVEIDKMSPYIIWMNYFLKAQGYKAKDTIYHQDKKSTILLSENGWAYRSKRTKHIYYIFFIEELIKAGKLRVKWFCKDNILGG